MGSNAIVYVDETVGQGKLRLRQKVWKKRVRNLLFSLFSRGQSGWSNRFVRRYGN